MVIAIDTRINNKDHEEEYENFIHYIFKKITGEYPQHTFIFITDKQFNFSAKSSIVIERRQKNNFLSQLQDDLKISFLLKKQSADVFISTKCLMRTNVSQCLVVYSKIKTTYLKKAERMIVNTQFSKKNLTDNFKINPDKIEVVYPEPNEIFEPVDYDKKEEIKNEYASGNEFFLFIYPGNQQNFVSALKAFSVFKKRQKSNMQLIVFVKKKNKKQIVEQLRLYKFKKDVKILEDLSLEESAKITASAYAVIYLPCSDEHVLPYFEAMKCEVPLIISNTEVSAEICAGTALYANANDHTNIADKLMLLFKDEKLKSELIQKQRLQLKNLSNTKTAEQLYLLL